MFSWRDNAHKHMRIHVDKPVGCFRCHESFRDEEAFTQHQLKHKRDDAELRAKGLPVPPPESEHEDFDKVITIRMPANEGSKIGAKSGVVKVGLTQQALVSTTNIIVPEVTSAKELHASAGKVTQASKCSSRLFSAPVHM